MARVRQPRATRRTSQLIARLAIATVIGLVLALGIDLARSGGPASWLARHGLHGTGYTPRGQRIDVDGRAMYLDCRGQGSPTAVLESGLGTGVEGWAPVFDDLAALTRTCAYDRAGIGRSEPRARHTVRDATAALRSLLAAAGERPPYVVVGHSLGEVHARVFAADDPGAMAGLLLVDGFGVDLEADHIHPLLGDLRPEYAARLQGLRDLVAQVEVLDWPTSEAQLRATDLRGIPVEVLSAPRGEPRLDAATNAEIASTWQAAYESLSPGHVRYELAWGAGHIIQADRPDLVIAAVQRLVAGR